MLPATERLPNAETLPDAVILPGKILFPLLSSRVSERTNEL